MTIGVFDGVHLGHQHLLSTTINYARQLGGASAVVTFDPHPDTVLHPERQRKVLCSLDMRLELLATLGVDHTVVATFDAAFAGRTAEHFMADLCRHIPLRTLCVGYDFRLGYRGLGTFDVLSQLGEQLGYAIHAVSASLIDGQVVSSTRIREELAVGNVVAAQHALGRPFALRGLVVPGDQRGRTIGYPTANVAVEPDQLLPADGVYATWARPANAARWLPSVTNIGVRPTFGTLGRTVECHLIDWQGDLYGSLFNLEFAARLRGEQRFAGIDELVKQINVDTGAATERLRSLPTHRST
ncbi:MAG: bifunctional riboflavin kinase/FAD synthetase [Herpetosiphon sp.]